MAEGKRSRGAGGGLGVTANTSKCAVEGCSNPGKAQQCPYDGAYHRHGGIHYWGDYPNSKLKFREDDWYWICDEHYRVCCDERAAYVKEVREQPESN